MANEVNDGRGQIQLVAQSSALCRTRTAFAAATAGSFVRRGGLSVDTKVGENGLDERDDCLSVGVIASQRGVVPGL